MDNGFEVAGWGSLGGQLALWHALSIGEEIKL
jgi:hypothetical protein